MAGFPTDPSSVTAEWLSEVLCADVRNCRLEQIAIGVGLLGRLYRAHLDGAPDVPRSVVVKVPLAPSAVRSSVCEDLEFYLREVRFYQEIGLANPLRPARAYFSGFDETTHDFLLVLEDLGRLRVADQIVGCSTADAETVIDAIARHHRCWWESRRFTALPWLKSFNTPPFPAAFAENFEAAWPRFLDGVGANLSAAMRSFGERFAALIPWFWQELGRPPHTFLHGDLRLDQLFFGVAADDPSVTALDWQVTSKGRAAYDVAYFVSQSLATETRRSCERQLVERYAEELAQQGIDYPLPELWRDYRLTTAWCFAYPVIAAGRLDLANDRQLQLLRTMSNRAGIAIEDHDALSLRPD
ncbi:phosphotransferase [Mycobacterium sp. 852002-51163_SCH5372311]|uniref:phosphotransferase n=1 Tax=Mycobacterium sp. 852002-51163_SCH5372311 TaxID=1834097 RepID=UPI0007FF9064|nr:phosphotransferase [Mycobacterium sp. 852002-51163_SCH5372311]OBF80524.1 phosphotransferase [Mycobacterium sp. 852002-51163_SCH5372311]